MLWLVFTLLNQSVRARDVTQATISSEHNRTAFPESNVIDSMLQLDVRMQSPTIVPYVKQYTLRKGSSHMQQCVSTTPISWYREEDLPWTFTEFKPCVKQDVPYNASYCSSLVFTNASVEQVGRYYCAKDDAVQRYHEHFGWNNTETLQQYLADLEAEFHAASFYLFVHDPDRPLIPADTMMFIGHVLRIPCKPTSPQVEVDLIDTSGKDVEGIYSSTDGMLFYNYQYAYNSKFFCRDHYGSWQDFVDSSVGKRIDKRSDEFDTKPYFLSIAVNVVNTYATTLQLFFYEKWNKMINTMYNVVPSGASVHLLCGISSCERYTYRYYSLDILPSSDVKSQPNVTFPKIRSSSFRSNIAWCGTVYIYELIVEAVTAQYSGSYRCEVNWTSSEGINRTTFSSLKLYVLDSSDDFLYFSEGNKDITIRIPKVNDSRDTDAVAKAVTVGINYNCYACNISCAWYRDGTSIEALCGNCSEQYAIRHKWKRESLTILRPSVWDSGRYTVECSVGNSIKRNSSRDVFIEDGWHLRMASDHIEIDPFSPIQLVCRSRGAKNPTFNLAFIECAIQLWEECKTTGVKRNQAVQANSTHSTVFEVYYAFEIIPKKSGILICEVSSKLGTKSIETMLKNPRQVESEAQATLNRQNIVTAVLLAALMMMIFFGLVCGCRVYTNRKAKLTLESTRTTVDTDVLSFLPDVYKFPREKVQLYKRIGQGEFGVTWLARVSGISDDPSLDTDVAVKEARERKDDRMTNMLLSELRTHIHAGHHVNVVNLIGAVVDNFGQGELLLIMEYCRFGNLQVFLQQNRDFFDNTANGGLFGVATQDARPSTSTSPAMYPFSTIDLLCWSYQVACGMDYLCTSGLIHGDLAARNVLLCDESIVKICDFGLARITRRDDVYRKKGNERLPLAWMAVESIRDRIFSTSSDVWSYGVLLWELFALGAEPYSSIMVNETLLNMLEQGFRMQQPTYATAAVYSTMMACWEDDPTARPTFKELCAKLNEMLPTRLRKQYARLNEPYVFMNALSKETAPSKSPVHIYVNESVLRPMRMNTIATQSDDAGQTAVIQKPQMKLPDILDT